MDHHDYRIDRLRLLASFGVVLIHSTPGTGVGDLALNALFRFSVPVFVIISGWFQLGRPVQVEHLLMKCVRLFGKMLIWSGIYMLCTWVKNGSWPENIIWYFLTEPVHLWYLYATMGLYILTPALAPFVRNAEKREYQYALVLCFLLGSVAVTIINMGWFPLIEVILDHSKLPRMLGFLFLYLLGGYFRRFGLEKRKHWLVTGILCEAFQVFALSTPWCEQLMSFLSPTVLLSSAACFVLYTTRKPIAERYRRTLRRASECTMGVYLLHMLIGKCITLIIAPLQASLFSIEYLILHCLCTFTISMLIIWLITLIKPLKKVLL